MALFVALLAGCAPVQPVDGPFAVGEVAGHSFAARVDSDIARYYLEDYPETHPETWHESLMRLEPKLGTEAIDSALLQELIETHESVDLAALVFVRHVHADPRNRAHAECLAAISAAIEQADDPREAVSTDAIEGMQVLFAPGWLYEDHDVTGADFARTRTMLDRVGMDYIFVPTAQDGSVEDNAAELADAVRGIDDNRPVVVVSASKSGAEVHHMLGTLLEPEETGDVAAWINAGGILRGTQIADDWTRFPRSVVTRIYFLWQGWHYGGARSLRTDTSQARFAAAELPEHILVLNYVGVPMSSQLTLGADQRHQRLAEWGPNDGATLLLDALVPEGVTLVEPGADHYFTRVDIDQRTLAMIELLYHVIHEKPCPA